VPPENAAALVYLPPDGRLPVGVARHREGAWLRTLAVRRPFVFQLISTLRRVCQVAPRESWGLLIGEAADPLTLREVDAIAVLIPPSAGWAAR
jgi:hypothetical protein